MLWGLADRKQENAIELWIMVYLIFILRVFFIHRDSSEGKDEQGLVCFIPSMLRPRGYVFQDKKRICVFLMLTHWVLLVPSAGWAGHVLGPQKRRKLRPGSAGSHFTLSEGPEVTELVCKNKLMLRYPLSVSPTCSGSQLREILSPRGHLALSGDGYNCHNSRSRGC